jgi:hypothetical protein
MFVLKKVGEDCATAVSVSTTDYFAGISYSAMVTLVDNQDEYRLGAVARAREIAVGKLNELDVGYYQICYAPVHTSGDSGTDFEPLSVTFNILPPTPGGATVSGASIVPLGADVFVDWQASVGYTPRVSNPGSWVALYKHKECDKSSSVNLENLHRCYLAFKFLPENEPSGQVQFTVADYKLPGLYEARYFRGDTLNGQGQACQGIADYKLQEQFPYLQCVFEASAVSGVINVPGDVTHVESISGDSGMAAHVHRIEDASMLDKFRREHP